MIRNLVGSQVRDDPALTPVEGGIGRLIRRCRVRRVDVHHAGPLIGQHYRSERPGDLVAETGYPDAVQWPRFGNS